MMKNLLAIAAVACAMSASAHNISPNELVWLRPTCDAKGNSGMRLEWSADSATWHSIGNSYSFVSNDFGPWGSHKKMFDPQLWRNADGSWTAQWYVSPKRESVAIVNSPDLVYWDYQDYQPASAATNHPAAGKVDFATVKRLIDYTHYRSLKSQQESESLADDAQRYIDLKPITISVKPDFAAAKPISDKLIGIFFEDINYAADGGLYAELVRNRDFEFNSDDHNGWNSTIGWAIEGTGMEMSVDTANPIHPNNAHYLVLDVQSPGASLVNSGFDGIPVKYHEKYDLSMRLQGAQVEVALVAPDDKVLASAKLSGGKDWRTAKAVLHASQACDSATLRITPLSTGRYALDMVSLFPQSTFKGRKNGLRDDLACTLADLKPRFVRFPGGCVAHGNGIDNIYDWKGSIGPLEARKPLFNLWGYHQTRGLGYYEYFQFCEDINAEPLPVLSAGVPCQNSGHASHHSHDEITSLGQQCGIPMEEMDQYVQDVLDLIEWANGDPKKSKWAKMRADAGHPAPFNLKYVGIGNEDLITPIFEERFKMIFDAVKAKYPEITVVGTVGPYYEGTDYTRGWQFATEQEIPMVDEHYYVSPGWLINNRDYYDAYDRNRSKVYLGEYASHNQQRTNTIETALTDALYLTDVERNADVVAMASYAPLLAKQGNTQWRPDMIYFNNTEIFPSTDYYVQQMYGQNQGNSYIPSAVEVKADGYDVDMRVGVSIVKDDATGDNIIKVVNLLPVRAKLNLDIESLGEAAAPVTVTTLAGQWNDQKARPVLSSCTLGELSDTTLPPYSFTVYRMH